MSQWIEHDGSKCPVNGETVIEVRFRRDLMPWIPNVPTAASKFRWTHKNIAGDVVAYRIPDPSP